MVCVKAKRDLTGFEGAPFRFRNRTDVFDSSSSVRLPRVTDASECLGATVLTSDPGREGSSIRGSRTKPLETKLSCPSVLQSTPQCSTKYLCISQLFRVSVGLRSKTDLMVQGQTENGNIFLITIPHESSSSSTKDAKSHLGKYSLWKVGLIMKQECTGLGVNFTFQLSISKDSYRNSNAIVHGTKDINLCDWMY